MTIILARCSGRRRGSVPTDTGNSRTSTMLCGPCRKSIGMAELFREITGIKLVIFSFFRNQIVGKVWIKIFPDKPVTAKPAETRMGSGKGTLEYWVAVVKPGRVMFEIAGVPEETAREALRLAMHKLPCKCKIVSRADLEGGDNSEN